VVAAGFEKNLQRLTGMQRESRLAAFSAYEPRSRLRNLLNLNNLRNNRSLEVVTI
jgi:hypothetical protein